MRYFTENKNDFEGYRKNIETLEVRLNHETYSFMLDNSFHDSLLNKLTVLNHYNNEEPYDSKISPVFVSAQLTYWNDEKYELFWEDVSVHSVDFDITRNKMVETGLILYGHGLDQWSHDELLLIENGNLRHEIFLFSQTTIIIECKKFSIKQID